MTAAYARQWDLQMPNRREPSFAAVQQDGDKPVFAPVEPAHHSRAYCLGSADFWPVFSGQLNRAQSCLDASSTALKDFSALICS